MSGTVVITAVENVEVGRHKWRRSAVLNWVIMKVTECLLGQSCLREEHAL